MIQDDLLSIRHEYENSDISILVLCLKSMGVDANDIHLMDRSEMIEHLMFLEEHAAFH